MSAPARGTPQTVTVELVAGPLDGQVQPYTRVPGEEMPADLPDHPGYRLLALDTRVYPPRWRYAWQAPRTGQRNRCRHYEVGQCGPTCPSRAQGAR